MDKSNTCHAHPLLSNLPSAHDFRLKDEESPRLALRLLLWALCFISTFATPSGVHRPAASHLPGAC